MSWRQLDLLNSQFKNGEVVEVKWGKEWLEAKVIEGRKGGTYEVKFMADDFRKIASKNEIRKGRPKTEPPAEQPTQDIQPPAKQQAPDAHVTRKSVHIV